MSDTPNGTHSLQSSTQLSAEGSSEARPLAPEEHSQNGVVCEEGNPSSAQEASTDFTKEPSEEIERRRQSSPTPPTMLEGPPPIQTTPLAPPQPPTLVPRVAESSRSEMESGVRTAPPALVGYEALDKEVSHIVTTEKGGVETSVSETCPMDTGPAADVVSPGHIAEDTDNVATSGGCGDDNLATQPKRDVREESPTLVIDTGSQSEQEGESAPVISEPKKDGHKAAMDKLSHMTSAESRANNDPLLSSESFTRGHRMDDEPASPQSTSSNEEDVELEMDIIEEGEEEEEGSEGTSPPLKGVLIKPATAASSSSSAISQAHIQPITSSSSHPRIGVSPSHTASRLAMENLKKGDNDVLRKPNVIVANPSVGGIAMFGSGGGAVNNTSKEGDSDSARDRQTVVTDNFRVRQVAKVKQFFTTLQKFGNKNGSEVAEQVQELIIAVVVREFV